MYILRHRHIASSFISRPQLLTAVCMYVCITYLFSYTGSRFSVYVIRCELRRKRRRPRPSNAPVLPTAGGRQSVPGPLGHGSLLRPGCRIVDTHRRQDAGWVRGRRPSRRPFRRLNQLRRHWNQDEPERGAGVHHRQVLPRCVSDGLPGVQRHLLGYISQHQPDSERVRFCHRRMNERMPTARDDAIFVGLRYTVHGVVRHFARPILLAVNNAKPQRSSRSNGKC